MRKKGGFLLVLLLATLAIITTTSGDETDSTHQAHLTADYGPLIASCDICHNSSYTGVFTDDQDLANTTVCDPCHSPGGAYDGVNDPNIGAKGNWGSGVYNGSALQAGKEKWCVGCHDDAPSVVNGVSAPNIAGNDVDYGYYKTGHGKHGYEKAVGCLECHDPALMHVDGEARTYTYYAYYDCIDPEACSYQAGYRLKLVDGGEPLDVPRRGGFTADQFRLCFSCHESTPFLNSDNTDTNFRSDLNSSCQSLNSPVNMHWYHLQDTGQLRFRWDSDWDPTTNWGNRYDSTPNCPACHNIHGPRLRDGASHAPAMIRTGELIGRETSLNLDYFTSECPDITLSPTNELFDDTGDSTGGSLKWIGAGQGTNTKNGVCFMCHNENGPYWREAKDVLSCVNCHGDLQTKHTATPGSDWVMVFAAGQHDSAMVGDGEIYIACTNCHTNNLVNIHGNNCAACHAGSPSPKDSLGGSWAGGCQQGGCHTTYHGEVSDKHNEVTDYAGESNCLLCHGSWSIFTVEPTACANCHATIGSDYTTPPVTTSDVQPSYIGPARINFTIRNNNDKVVLGTTYYQVDGGELQTGSSVLITESGAHTLQFWSIDQVGNEESMNTVGFTIALDTTPPVTTSNAQSTYNNIPAIITLTATDNSSLGVKTTYYKINGGSTQTGNYVYIAFQPGSNSYTLQFWSEDWSLNMEDKTDPDNTVSFTITGGPATLRLIWGDSDTSGSPCQWDSENWAEWTIRVGTSGPVVATGYGYCQEDPNWSGVDDIVLPVSPTPYSAFISWWDSYWEWEENENYTGIYLTTYGQLEVLRY